jgi:hypothetical protein
VLESATAPLPRRVVDAVGCPAGAEDFSAIVFSCQNCTFASATGVRFVLHYSCQALHVGIAAAGPADKMNLASESAVVYTRFVPHTTLAPAPATTGDAPATLLKTVQLTASAMLASVTDARAQFWFFNAPNLTGTGYLLGTSAASATFSSLDTLQGEGGSGFSPRANGVTVTVQLTQAGLYATTTVQRVTSIMQLLSQIVSLLALVNVFGTVLELLRRVYKKYAPSAAGAEVSDALAPLREELAALSTEVARQKRALADVRARAGAPATDEAPATEKEVQSRAIDVGSPTATVKGAQGGGEAVTAQRLDASDDHGAGSSAFSYQASMPNAQKYGFWMGAVAELQQNAQRPPRGRHSLPTLFGAPSPSSLPPLRSFEFVNPLNRNAKLI